MMVGIGASGCRKKSITVARACLCLVNVIVKRGRMTLD